MKRKILGICDTEKGFVGAFSHFIQSKEGQRFDVRGFSKGESLFDFLKDEQFDVAFVTESFLEKHGAELGDKINRDTTFLLCDEDDQVVQGFRTLDRYKPAESILKKAVEVAFSEDEADAAGQGKKTILTGVYSPIGRCGKTALSLALAEAFAQRASTLLLSFDAVSGYQELETEYRDLSVSDLLFMLSENSSLDGDIKEMLLSGTKGENPYLLGAVSNPEDIYGVEGSMIEKTLRTLKDLGCFKYIVVDFGPEVSWREGFSSLCNQMVLLASEDEISNRKLERWKKFNQKFPFERSKTATGLPRSELENWASQYVRSHS